MPPTSNELLVRKILFILFLAILLEACMFTHSYGYNAYFCTTTPSTGKRFLYINDKQVGELPYGTEIPGCDEMPAPKLGLHIALSSGEHLVEIKNAKGAVLFSEELEIHRRKGSASVSSTVENPGWDTRVKIKDDCLVIGLMY